MPEPVDHRLTAFFKDNFKEQLEDHAAIVATQPSPVAVDGCPAGEFLVDALAQHPFD